MEDFIWRLAVAVIPLFFLIGSAILFTIISEKTHYRSLSKRRTRRYLLRALAGGVMLR